MAILLDQKQVDIFKRFYLIQEPCMSRKNELPKETREVMRCVISLFEFESADPERQGPMGPTKWAKPLPKNICIWVLTKEGTKRLNGKEYIKGIEKLDALIAQLFPFLSSRLLLTCEQLLKEFALDTCEDIHKQSISPDVARRNLNARTLNLHTFFKHHFKPHLNFPTDPPLPSLAPEMLQSMVKWRPR